MKFKQLHNSNTTNHESTSSLLTFPNELLLLLFESLDISTILSLSDVCNRFLSIGQVCLAKKLKDLNLGLSLIFDQEYRQIYNVEFAFEQFELESGRFIFIPKKSEVLRFTHSRMIMSPKLRKVIFTGIDDGANSDYKNFIQRSCTLSVESNNSILQKISTVYRIGRGLTHLKTQFKFTYSISDIPPLSTDKIRRGERWLTPVRFECLSCFFYPHEPIARKIIRDIIHFKRRNNQTKKNNTKSRDLSEISLSNTETIHAINEQRPFRKRFYHGVRG
ncbi:6616_t:CDS:1 [Dentiscutata erythropus]|uniref:6616_t:CDS:1 n=1 Tax=Dentiscutata erythropus TaxID=1348616 RepID=A0A9N9EP37_9GLOM|nr:6616_t:CDS:1 [Dentiscutata erythropus]